MASKVEVNLPPLNVTFLKKSREAGRLKNRRAFYNNLFIISSLLFSKRFAGYCATSYDLGWVYRLQSESVATRPTLDTGSKNVTLFHTVMDYSPRHIVVGNILRRDKGWTRGWREVLFVAWFCVCCNSLLRTHAHIHTHTHTHRFSLSLLWSLLPTWVLRFYMSLYNLVKLLVHVRFHATWNAGKKYSMVDSFENLVDKDPSRVQFIFVEEDRKVTLKDLDTTANQISHWGIKMGLKPGDTIALMMTNRPEYVAFWIGMAKIGVATALLNTNTSGKALIHVVDVSTRETSIKLLVVDRDVEAQARAPETASALASLGVGLYVWEDLYEETRGPIASACIERPPRELRKNVVEKNVLMYIFTSGTTGLPKASKISHSRWYCATLPFAFVASLKSTDVIYTVLPLYHSAAGMMGVGAALRSGACMVLKKKFSARAFASDCVKYNVNVVQYIGEICRYLLSSPPSPAEQDLRIEVRLM